MSKVCSTAQARATSRKRTQRRRGGLGGGDNSEVRMTDDGKGADVTRGAHAGAGAGADTTADSEADQRAQGQTLMSDYAGR